MLDHLRLHLDAEDEEALQGFPGLVVNPVAMVVAQTGLDFAAIGEIHATDRGIVVDFVVEVRQFLGIVFEAAHRSIA